MRKLLSSLFMTAVLTVLLSCNNYDLYEKLSNPASVGQNNVSKCTICRVFATTSPYDGNLGGFTGADQKCQSDPGRPTNGIYKAMLVDNAGGRRACSGADCTDPAENIDWVLKPSTFYVKADGITPVFMTNTAGIFIFGTAGSISVDTAVWTGLGNGWISNTTHCSSWNSTTGNGQFGQPYQSTSALINAGSNTCATSTSKLYCVEQ